MGSRFSLGAWWTTRVHQVQWWLDVRARRGDVRIGIVVVQMPYRGGCVRARHLLGRQLPGWALARYDYAYDQLVTWWSARWWGLLVGIVVAPLVRLARTSGVLVVAPGCYWWSGRLRWPDMWARWDAEDADS